MRKHLSIALIILIALVSVFPLITHAQDGEKSGGRICYGWYTLDPDNENVVTGTISNNEPLHEWTFEGKAGTFASIWMEATDGTLDPYVYVTDKTTNERIVSASANDPTDRKIASIQSLPLASDGEYVITATRLGEQNGNTAGAYKLGLEPGLEKLYSEDFDELRQEARIFDGEVVRGQLPEDWNDFWHFDGQRGQRVTIVVRGIEGTTIGNNDVYIDLIRFNDNQWVRYNNTYTNQPSNGELRIVNFELETSGHHIISVGPYGQSLDNYEVTLAGAGGLRPELPECGGPIPECAPTSPLGAPAETLANDVAASGSVTGANPIAAFEFLAAAGDSVGVTMQRTGGDLDTFLGLVDSRGNILARDEGFDPASSAINQFEVPADGCYYIYASRDGVSDGTTEGTFLITLTGSSAAGGGAVPQPPADIAFGGDIARGETATASVGTGDWQIAYRLKGEGGTITAKATRASGDLKPAITLYNAEFDQINYVSADFAGNASNPLTFEAESGTYYFIVVQREGGESGASAGDFTLTVE